MTKKERAYILERAKEYQTWAKQERTEAKNCFDPEEREEHYDQAIRSDAAADAIYNLLYDLMEGV